jgi:RNA polymerase sigma-70 factor (ECF subfamily)
LPAQRICRSARIFDHKAGRLLPLSLVTALRELKQQDLDAVLDFRRIFEQYGRYVWRLLRRMGVPEADTPDVAQEVFMILRRKLHHVHAPGALRPFLYGIAVREASAYRRSARVRHEMVTDAPPDQRIDAGQEDDIEKIRARAVLEAALARLDDGKRAVFVLYELEELDMREIASAVGCPIQTAYSRLHAARRLVTAAFAASEGSAG